MRWRSNGRVGGAGLLAEERGQPVAGMPEGSECRRGRSGGGGDHDPAATFHCGAGSRAGRTACAGGSRSAGRAVSPNVAAARIGDPSLFLRLRLPCFVRSRPTWRWPGDRLSERQWLVALTPLQERADGSISTVTSAGVGPVLGERPRGPTIGDVQEPTSSLEIGFGRCVP
jgi:hypothetical protein